MNNKRKYPSRQVRRRTSKRRRAKRIAKKENAQKGSQKRKKTQETDKPERKDNWRFGIDMLVRLLSPFIRDVADKVIDFLQS